MGEPYLQVDTVCDAQDSSIPCGILQTIHQTLPNDFKLEMVCAPNVACVVPSTLFESIDSTAIVDPHDHEPQ